MQKLAVTSAARKRLRLIWCIHQSAPRSVHRIDAQLEVVTVGRSTTRLGMQHSSSFDGLLGVI
jgi:hypothetical protein